MKRFNFTSVFGLLWTKLSIYFVLIYAALAVFEIHNNGFNYALALLFALTIFWVSIFQRKWFKEEVQVFFQLFLDIPLENVLIHYSGGIESPFIFLLIFDLIYGAFALNKKKLFILSVYICISYVLFNILAYLNFMPKFLNQENQFVLNPDVYFFYVVFMRVFIFFMIGYLASHLSGKIYTQQETILKMKDWNEKILSQMKSAVISTDENDQVVYMNDAARQYVRHSDFIFKPLGEVLKEYFSEKDLENFTHQNYIDSYECEMNLGTQSLPVEIAVNSITEGDQKSGKIFLIKDLSFAKEVEELRNEQKKLLTFKEFSSALAHEIKNPLASICGSLEVLMEKNAISGEKNMKMVEVVIKESDRLSRTLTEFLNFSGEFSLKKVGMSPVEIIRDVMMIIENHDRQGKTIEISFNTEVDDQFQIELDPDALRQILMNLMLNSIEACGNQGRIDINLKIIHSENNQFLELEICDNGRGIPEDLQKNIFKPFFTTRNKGIGLGLSVCKNFCDRMDWILSFRSQELKGTSFKILIPV